jgi:hypothetical protein
MTHIGYAKPKAFIAFEAFDTITRLELTSLSILFLTSADFKVQHTLSLVG